MPTCTEGDGHGEGEETEVLFVLLLRRVVKTQKVAGNDKSCDANTTPNLIQKVVLNMLVRIQCVSTAISI